MWWKVQKCNKREGRGGGGGHQLTFYGGWGVGGSHHALQQDDISLLTGGQKEELTACTGLYRCVAMHHGKQPSPC